VGDLRISHDVPRNSGEKIPSDYSNMSDVLARLIHAIIDGEDDYSSLKDGDGDRGVKAAAYDFGVIYGKSWY